MELNSIVMQQTANPVQTEFAAINLSGVAVNDSAHETRNAAAVAHSATVETAPQPQRENIAVLREQALQVREAIRQANQAYPNRVRFDIDPHSGQVIVRVIDKNTQEVIRQIPPEEILRIAENIRILNRPIKGVVLDQTS